MSNLSIDLIHFLGSVEIELNIYKLMVFSEVFPQVIEIIVFFKDYI